MLLSSSLDPTGPKSTNHYIILHRNDHSELIELPKTYSDLKNEIKRIFHLDGRQFHVETNELNICAGKPIRIPEGLWSGVAELLGNVDVVLRELDEHPECPPEPSSQTTPASGTSLPKPISADGASTGTSDLPDFADKDVLYHLITACEPQKAGRLSEALEAIRTEIATSGVQHSTSGVKWYGQGLPRESWSNFEWRLGQRSICVIRFTLAAECLGQFHFVFGPWSMHSLWVHLNPHNNNVNFSEKEDDGPGSDVVYHTISLEKSIDLNSPGEHSVAFVKHGESLQVVFDFKSSHILPDRAHTTVMARKPTEMFVLLDENCTSIAVDVYKFH